MKRIFTLLFLVCMAANVYAQDRYIKSHNGDFGPPAPYKGAIQYYTERGADYPGSIPGTASFFDYMTNGSNLSVISVFGDTVIVSYFGADSTDPTGLTSRLAAYVVSYDAGATWTVPLTLTNLPQRSAYAELQPYVLAGARNVALSGRLYTEAGTSRGGAWAEALLGLGSISQQNVPISGLDYFAHYLNGNNIGGISTVTGDSLFFMKYDFTTNTFNVASRRLISAPPEATVNIRYRFTADDTGNNMFALWWGSTAGSESMSYKSSADGGNTWGATQVLHQSLSTGGVINGDTTGPWFGMDAIYKPGTTTPYASWSTLYPTGSGLSSGDNQGTKIVIWSPALNGGSLVEVAGKSNMNIISDTSLFFQQDSSQTGVTPVSHPSIAFTDNGILLCAFSGFQPTDVFQNYNFNDIYITYSMDNGATWATPKNITNTPDWDELYPSISETGNTGLNDVHIKYMANRIPGSQSFTNNRPVSKVFHVYQNLTNVGVNNVSNEVPASFSLKQNYPNPFNPTTNIRFEISKATKITLKVYDVVGKEVATLVNNEAVTPGTKEVTFEGKNISSGIYFYTLTTAEGLRDTKKMMLLK